MRLLLAVAILYSLSALTLAIIGLHEDYQPSDAGVVFGNKVEPSGEPSPSLASRLDKTIKLYRLGYFPAVIVSGGMGKEGWDEAQVMADYLANQGIPRSAILVDHAGNNT